MTVPSESEVELIMGVFRDCTKCTEEKCQKKQKKMREAKEFIKKAKAKYGKKLFFVGVSRNEIEEEIPPKGFPKFIYLLRWEIEGGHTYPLDYVYYQFKDGMVVIDFLLDGEEKP